MKKSILSNGATLLIEKTNTDSVSIVVCVNVGSNNEPKNLLGISHFLEHMIFEGTKKRANATIITNEIEQLGGELNAYTTNETTVFYIKLLGRYFDTALDIMVDMLQNSIFPKHSLEKERKVILKEINMITDEPRFHQWILFMKTLFKTHPAKNPTYGTIKTVKTISRDDIMNYYKDYYSANNIIISVAGKFSENNTKKVMEKFGGLVSKNSFSKAFIEEPKQNKPIIKIENRNILNSYMVFGYKTPTRETYESYVLDVIKAILARGQSGKIVERIRNEKGLAYEVNLQHDANSGFGIFAIYLNSYKRNINQIKRIIIEELNSLRHPKERDIKIAKGFIEGHYKLDNEDTFRLADKLAFWEHIESAKLHYSYIDRIKGVTREDIIKVSKKYLDKNFTMVLIAHFVC